MPIREKQPEISTLLVGEGIGHVAADWKSIFEKAGLRTLEDFFTISGKALSKPGLGKRYRAQLELDPSLVFYKRYDGESLRGLLQRWSEDGERNAIAAREVNVANALEKIGIRTFHPLAWGWTKGWGVRQKSFVVMSQVPGNSIERWLTTVNLNWRQKLRLVEQVAKFARSLHKNGWFHRDFYLCHIFIQELDGSYQLALVDLARMFQPRWRVRRWQIKDLAQLNYSALTKDFSKTMRLRFVKIYFGCASLNSEQKTILRTIHRRTEQIRRRDLAKQPEKKR